MQRLFLFALILIPALIATSSSPAPAQAAATPATQRQSALTLEQQGQLPEAEAAWRSILNAHPSDVEASAHLGLLAARQEHYKEAIVFYRKALALNPQIPGLRLNLALALFKDGNLKEAIPELNSLLKAAQPGSPDAQRDAILLGMAHYGLAEYAAAVPYLKQATAADPQNLPLRITLAHSCLWSQQYPCVLDTYKEILTLNADSAEAHILAGEAYDAMKDRDNAITEFRAAVKADPHAPDAHFGLGYLYWTRKQFSDAVPEFEAELANDPQHIQSTLYLGDAQMQLHQPDQAKTLLEKAAKMDPSLWLAHLDLGIMADDAGQKEEALQEMQEAARLKPDEVSIHWRLGRLYREAGKTDDAKAEFAKANALTTADDSIVKRMGPAHTPTPGRQPLQ